MNAGPPHSYVLMADGKTKYIAELTSGDEVMLVSDNGKSRAATIGRLKIEKRPFLRISWEMTMKYLILYTYNRQRPFGLLQAKGRWFQ